MKRCVYCGLATKGVACWMHRDLLRLDPHYREARDGAVREWTPKP